MNDGPCVRSGEPSTIEITLTPKPLFEPVNRRQRDLALTQTWTPDLYFTALAQHEESAGILFAVRQCSKSSRRRKMHLPRG